MSLDRETQNRESSAMGAIRETAGVAGCETASGPGGIDAATGSTPDDTRNGGRAAVVEPPNSSQPGGMVPAPPSLAETVPGVASASNSAPGASCAGGSFSPRPSNSFWTDEEKEALRRAWYDPAWSLADMVTSLRRTLGSIQSKACDMNLGGRPKAGGLGARHPLSDAEQARILQLRDAGMARKDIAAQMKRGCRLVAAFLNANSPPKPPPKPRGPTLAEIRGPNWWEPLPPFHPIAAAELERARRLEL